MEIETHEIPLQERERYQTRLKSYHAELSKLEKDLVSCTLLIEHPLTSPFSLVCFEFNVLSILFISF